MIFSVAGEGAVGGVARSKWEWLAPASGLAFVALTIASFALLSLPGYGASRSAVAFYFVHHHRLVLVAGSLEGLALVAFLWFLGGLASALRAAGQSELAAVAFGGGLLGLAIGAAGTMIMTALSLRVARDDPSLAKGLYDLRAASSTFLAFPLAALAMATALAMLRGRLRPVSYGFLSVLTGLVTLGRAGALVDSGFYSPGGGYGFYTSILVLFWVVMTSLVLGLGGPAAEELEPLLAARSSSREG